ncbi:hypothetical protein ACS0TY_001960 [Phlomoides rotata]
MEHPFFPTTTTRAEALRWLTIAEKLLSARDLMGSKSFATRARDSDPTLTPADQILAVVDTLLAGDRRIGNNQQDWYAILRLTPQQGRESELIATQYRNLAILLNPQKNKFPFAEQAFRLTVDAWTVLSNPSRKSMYDKELSFYFQPHQQQPDPFINPNPALHQNFIFFGGSSSSGGTPPSQPQVPVHFSQVPVHANPHVDPVGGGSGREPQNFMSFPSGSNLAFGGASGSKVAQEMVNKQGQESYPAYAGNVTAAPEEQNYSNVDEKTSHNVNENVNVNVNESENLGEGIGDEEDAEGIGAQEERMGVPENDGGLTFWTACPYCYHMYEYPRKYVDCTLRCQNCRKAFEAVVIPSPPPIMDGQGGYFCCWGFFPLGFSMEQWEKNRGAASSWNPFSPMFTCPQGGNDQNAAKRGGRRNTGPRVYIDDDAEVFVELSDSGDSDDDWNSSAAKRRKKAKNVKGKGASGITTRSAKKSQVDKGKNVTVSVQDGNAPPPPNGVETQTPNKTVGDSTKKGAAVNARKQPGRVAKNFGKLDLNVEFSNEAEEAAAPRVNHGNGPSRGEDDNIEGIGFFEGLDEFLSSLPILNVVGEDKVVKAA